MTLAELWLAVAHYLAQQLARKSDRKPRELVEEAVSAVTEQVEGYDLSDH